MLDPDIPIILCDPPPTGDLDPAGPYTVGNFTVM